MKTIPLSKGRAHALVSDEDYEFLSQWTWSLWLKKSGAMYARRTVNRRGKKPQYITILMHRLLAGVTESSVHVDHWDGNGLNNQRHNIKACTRDQNLAKQDRKPTGTSRFRGVHKSKSGRWLAKVARQYLGAFDSEESAAQAYDQAAILRYAEFARPNLTGANN